MGKQARSLVYASSGKRLFPIAPVLFLHGITYSDGRGEGMNRYRKQLAAIFGAIALITYLSVRYFPQQESEVPVVAVQDEQQHMQVYLLDDDGMLVPLSIRVDEELSEEDRIQRLLGYMSGKQKVESFQPLFDKAVQANSITIKDGIVSLYFDDSFCSYDKENELRVLEALAWGCTQFAGISQVQLYLQDKQLTSMPNAKTPIPAILNQSIGINHFDTATTTLHDSESLVVFGTKKIADKTYMVPQSRRVTIGSGKMEDDVRQVMRDVRSSSGLQQPLYDNGIELVSCQFKDGTLQVDVRGGLLDEKKEVRLSAYECLVLSLATLPDVEHIQVTIDNVKVSPFTDQEATAVSDICYNEIQF